MRVISGKARRIELKTIDGMDTRPTTDRIKETLFNMINGDLYDCRFLDLFSGSGGIGIEALSRGAKSCCFVENSGAAMKCIEDNLKKTRLEEQATMMEMDAVSAVKRLESKEEEPFDFIFMDPPYGMMLEKEVLLALTNTHLVDEYTTIIIEASLETEFDYVEDMGYFVDRIKNYKTNKHIFISKR